MKTAAFFWTGSEVTTKSPDFWMTYDGTYPNRVKIEDVVNWIDKFQMELTFLYFDEPVSFKKS